MNKTVRDTIYKSLINFNDKENIEFNKSKVSLNRSLYNFLNCNPGDCIYKNDKFGYNLVDGELIGYCVIPAGILDKNPRFAYKEVLMDKDGNPKKVKWNSAKAACKRFRNKIGDFNFYCPNMKELYTAYDYAYNKGLDIYDKGIYWTKDYYKDEWMGEKIFDAYVLFMNNGKAKKYQTYDRDEEAYVIPFFTIPNKINESSNLMQFNNKDRIEFKKSENTVNNQVNNKIDEVIHFVDLGLPSGTLWCKHNLGATCENKPRSWYGNYYAWGETEPKKIYTEVSCKYESFTNTHDPSRLYIKESSTPSDEDFRELFDNTKHTWIDNYNGIKNLNGIKFIGTNGNSIFLPAAGYAFGFTYIDNENVCKYWTSSYNDSENTITGPMNNKNYIIYAYAFTGWKDPNKYDDIYTSDVKYGMPIRPIIKK